jgi:hypothetical protein
MRSLSGLGSALTCTTFSRKVKGAVLKTGPQTRISPGLAPALIWDFTWQVLDSNQGRHTSTVLQASPIHALTCAYVRDLQTSPAILRADVASPKSPNGPTPASPVLLRVYAKYLTDSEQTALRRIEEADAGPDNDPRAE